MAKKGSILPKEMLVPDHIVIIPDGNRRWARARGLDPEDGHKAGLEAMIKTLKATRKFGIHTATVWGLSTENWLERTPNEVSFLMKMISRTIDEYLKEAKKEGIRLKHLGRKDRLPKALLAKIAQAEKETEKNRKHILNIALDYGGQDEIVRAVHRIVNDKVKAEKIDEKLLDSYMDTADQPYPYPDLIIRTSGEQRTSGILLWQSPYAETYWERDHFPDFSFEKLKAAILDYSRRRRRFGGSDKIVHLTFRPEITARLELAWWRLAKIPAGTRFRDFLVKYLKEQYGLSKSLAKEAGRYLFEAVLERDKKNWQKSKRPLKRFYKLIKKHLKLAFEPEIVTSLRLKLWQDLQGKEPNEAGEVQETAQNFLAEEFRISHFQAQKAAHLRILAEIEKNKAVENGDDKEHWEKASDYLQKYYHALKERVA